MANSVGASSSGTKHDVAGSSHGGGSSLGGGSSHEGRREDDSRDEDRSGHDKGSPVLNYNVPAVNIFPPFWFVPWKSSAKLGLQIVFKHTALDLGWGIWGLGFTSVFFDFPMFLFVTCRSTDPIE